MTTNNSACGQELQMLSHELWASPAEFPVESAAYLTLAPRRGSLKLRTS